MSIAPSDAPFWLALAVALWVVAPAAWIAYGRGYRAGRRDAAGDERTPIGEDVAPFIDPAHRSRP